MSEDAEGGLARYGQGSVRGQPAEPELCLAEPREDDPAGTVRPDRAVIRFQNGDVLGLAAVTSSFGASPLRRCLPTMW